MSLMIKCIYRLLTSSTSIFTVSIETYTVYSIGSVTSVDFMRGSY